ncbi:galactan 5-O-arabinofuranosyltransferase [Nocardia sp. CWNU-33]|uniref:galactan 5-O-arabinofuranosyltransferase n=1 Tax=Nocardia sp. CWNU-33 TaxID=3392117 RepID=UPI00398F4669
MTTATAVRATASRPTRGALIARYIGSGLGEAVLAGLVAVIVATVGLVAFSMVQWPAFNSSNVTRALTTVGQVLAAVMLAVAIGLIRVRRSPLAAKLLSWVGVSTFVTFTLGMPLAATKLYLFGVSVDQEFRTEYLTRLTDSAALHDMTYADLPPFYPAGWFWIGGRVANVLGMDGWEAFKPYAIGSLAVAAAISLVLWSKLIRTDWAIGVTAAITAVALTTAAPEAYSAVIVILLPPALVLAWGALYRPGEHGRNASAPQPAAPIADGDGVAGDAGSAEPDSRTAGGQTPAGAADSAEHGNRTTSAQALANAVDPAEHGNRTTGAEAPASVVASAERGSRTAGGWGAVIGTGLFLGVAAMFYTLYFGLAAFAIGLMGLIAAGLAVREQRAAAHPRRARVVATTDGGSSWRAAIPPLVRLAVIGVIAGVVALVVWLPYLLKWVSTTTPKSGTALHYLPVSGSELPLPMAQFSLLGGLCLIGTAWLVVRASSSRRAQALGIGVVAIYLWTLLSMVATAAGTTLLSFRLEPILDVLLAAAGAFGFVEGARAAYQAFNEPGRFRLAVIAVATVGALAFTQDIPRVLAPEITTAYTDTDGNGERADKRSPSAVSHYREVDAALLAQTGRPRSDTVLLTADTSFLAFYPYYGFQALTSHYANPLADFAGRAATIKGWSRLDSPRAMLDALAAAPWRAPDAFLFRSNGDNYTLRLAEDVYPNDPNVKRYTVTFPKKLFNDPHFTTTDIGPFTLVTVTK